MMAVTLGRLCKRSAAWNREWAYQHAEGVLALRRWQGDEHRELRALSWPYASASKLSMISQSDSLQDLAGRD